MANQQEDRLVGALSGHDLLMPVSNVLKGLPVCHIKDQQDTHHIPVKGPGDAPDGEESTVREGYAFNAPGPTSPSIQ